VKAISTQSGQTNSSVASQLFTVRSPINWYVRTDGSNATNCTGQTDAAYPGSGTGQACAYDHPFYLLATGGTVWNGFAGGDTVIIEPGSYAMGCGPGAPQAAIDIFAGSCSTTYNQNAQLSVYGLPSGPDSTHPTTIEGKDEPSGCHTQLMPELYALGAPGGMFNMGGFSATSWTNYPNLGTANIKFGCLNIDDHVQYAYGGQYNNAPSLNIAIGRNGIQGLLVSNLILDNMWIHGLGATGCECGPLNGGTITNSVFSGNGQGGFDGTGGSYSNNEGTITATNIIVSLNGVLEPYPSSVSLPSGVTFASQIAAQNSTGMTTFPYDVPNTSSLDTESDGVDGMGFGHTGGTFIVSKAWVFGNTQDGIDTLYFDQQNAQVEESQVYAWGNSGNQLKGAGQFYIWNNFAVGNCDYLSTAIGSNYHGPYCRAGGAAMAIISTYETQSYVAFNTITGPPVAASSQPIFVGCRSISGGAWANCTTSDPIIANVTFKNNIILENGYSAIPYAWQGGGTMGTCSTPFCNPTIVDDHNDYWNTPTSGCPYVTAATGGVITSTNYLCQTDPLLLNETLGPTFEANLTSGSPVIGAGTPYMGITTDFFGASRPNPPAIGGVEYGSGTASPGVAPQLLLGTP
jgi:hypothetical protein